MIHIGPYTNQIKHTPTGIAASGTIRNAQVKTPTLRLRHHGKMPTTTGTNRKIMQNNVLVISQLLSPQFQLASVFAIRSTDETKSDIRRLGKHRLRYLLSLPRATDNLSDIFHFPYFKHYSSPTMLSIVPNSDLQLDLRVTRLRGGLSQPISTVFPATPHPANRVPIRHLPQPSPYPRWCSPAPPITAPCIPSYKHRNRNPDKGPCLSLPTSSTQPNHNAWPSQ